MSQKRIRLIARTAALGLAVLIALIAGAALVFAATPDHAAAKPARTQKAVRTLSITCRSDALGGRLPARVYLPPGYSTHGRRLPVVYFLHGLPATAESYTQNAFVAQSLLSAHRSAIVVAPQGARNDGDDREYLDWSPTEDWPRAISTDLTSSIDHRFHTIAARTGRALIGVSAGGYGAFNIGLRSLQTFEVVESWSGYFVATDPSGHRVLELPSSQAQRAATVPDGAELARELVRWPTLIAFYVGRADDRFLDMNQAFDAALRRHRIPHVFRTYSGGHSPALWQIQAPFWLNLALGYLATGQTSPPARTS